MRPVEADVRAGPAEHAGQHVPVSCRRVIAARLLASRASQHPHPNVQGLLQDGEQYRGHHCVAVAAARVVERADNKRERIAGALRGRPAHARDLEPAELHAGRERPDRGGDSRGDLGVDHEGARVAVGPHDRAFAAQDSPLEPRRHNHDAVHSPGAHHRRGHRQVPHRADDRHLLGGVHQAAELPAGGGRVLVDDEDPELARELPEVGHGVEHRVEQRGGDEHREGSPVGADRPQLGHGLGDNVGDEPGNGAARASGAHVRPQAKGSRASRASRGRAKTWSSTAIASSAPSAASDARAGAPTVTCCACTSR